ncbi:MAG: DUF6048 family protein [Bacteroidota bacterium]
MKIFIFFTISILWSLSAMSQEDESSVDTTLLQQPGFFSGISVTADIGKLGLAQLVEFEDKKAFTAHLEFFGKFQLSAEYGMGTIAPIEAFENVAYSVEGDYTRLGADYITNIKLKNFISFGVRRAMSNYSDKGTVTIVSGSDLSNDYQRSFARSNLSANWWEVVISSETKLTRDFTGKEMNALQKVLDNFYFGLHYRLKFALDYDPQEGIDTYTIPGYGRTFDRTVPAVSLYLRYRLGF